MKDSNSNKREMSKTIDRYLVSSLLLDNGFRHNLWRLVEKEDPCALAPEPGLDLHRLLYICQLIQTRETRYRRILASLTIVTLATLVAVPAGMQLAVLFFYATVIVAVKMYESNERNKRLLWFMLNQKSYLPEKLTEELERRYKAHQIRRPLPVDQQNVVVYSDFSPFVGAGVELNGWSFPVNINRPLEELGDIAEIQSFELAELYDFIDKRLDQCEFQNYLSQDYLFINGRQIRGLDWLLPEISERPLFNVPQAILYDYMNKSDPVVRHYKWIQVSGWEDVMILSYFLRFSRQGDHLFVEVNRFLLPPLQERYHAIDKIDEPEGFSEEIGEKISLLLGSIIVAPFWALWCTLATIGNVLSALGKWDPLGWSQRRRIAHLRRNHQYDYGARQSIRNQISSRSFTHYFQKLDHEMYGKVIEKQVLEALIEFLNDHKIDTSDIRERQKTILNTGLIVQGGALQAESLAVGKESRASIQQQVSKRMKGIAGGQTS